MLGLNARELYGLPSRHTGPAAPVHDYFAAVTRDPALLARVFTPGAVLDVDGERRVGLDSVLAYYAEHTFTYEDFRPDPGELQVEGASVTVEIEVHLGGTDSVVRDVFETEGDRITAVHVRGFESAAPRPKGRCAETDAPASQGESGYASTSKSGSCQLPSNAAPCCRFYQSPRTRELRNHVVRTRGPGFTGASATTVTSPGWGVPPRRAGRYGAGHGFPICRPAKADGA